MKHTNSITGFLCCSFLLIFTGALCFPCVTGDGGDILEVSGPEIISPSSSPQSVSVFNVSEGQRLKICCTVNPGFLEDETLVYWLVNNSFLERYYGNDRVKTGRVRMMEDGNVALLERKLIFKCVHEQDFNYTFTCVAQNPVGVDVRTVQLKKISSRRQKRLARCDDLAKRS